MPEQYYFGTSVLDLDLAAEMPEEFRELIGFVESTGKLDILYLPIGEFYISEVLPGLHINHQSQNPCGQVLLCPKTSNTLWHATTVNHFALYRTTRELLDKEEEILLYLSRRAPITDFEQIEKAVVKLRTRLNLQAPEPMPKQLESIIPKLPTLCDRCRQETGWLRPVPDEDNGVCPNCLEKHYRICRDCNKPVPLEEVRYDDEDTLCATCMQWGQSMGFR